MKGQLLTQSLFRTQEIKITPSFLFPNEKLTSDGNRKGQGLVYLIANDVGSFSVKQHALLGYEYITSHGQHIFKVVHLQYIKSENRTYIKIEKRDVISLTSWTRMNRLIARFRVDSQLIKLMQRSILEDEEYFNLPEIEYKSMIFGSSKNEKVMNCLTYCLMKMKDFLQINIVLNPIDFRPSAVVKDCINNQIHEEESTLYEPLIP